MFFGCKREHPIVVLDEFKDVDTARVISNVEPLLEGKLPFRIIDVPVIGEEVLTLSTILDSVSYIRLSTESRSIIGGVDRIEFTSDAIYILDRYRTRSVKKFSFEGQYLTDIGQKGGGPSEYIEPTDFEIVGDEVKIYDQFTSRMLTYDLDGNFRKSILVPFLFNRFHFLSDNDVLFYGLNSDNNHIHRMLDYSIYVSDSTFVLSHLGFYQKHNLYQTYFVDYDFAVKNDCVYFHPFYSDTIYSIDRNKQYNVEFVFDFKQMERIPVEYNYAENEHRYRKEDDRDRYVFFRTYQVMDDYLFYAYSKAHWLRYVFYSLKDKRTIGKGRFVKNDLNPLLAFSSIITSFGNTLVGVCNPYHIIETVNKTDKKMVDEMLSDENKVLLKSLKIEDNPILVFYHMKAN